MLEDLQRGIAILGEEVFPARLRVFTLFVNRASRVLKGNQRGTEAHGEASPFWCPLDEARLGLRGLRLQRCVTYFRTGPLSTNWWYQDLKCLSCCLHISFSFAVALSPPCETTYSKL